MLQLGVFKTGYRIDSDLENRISDFSDSEKYDLIPIQKNQIFESKYTL